MDKFTINITFPKDAIGKVSSIETEFLPRVGDFIEGKNLKGFRYVVTEVVLEIGPIENEKTGFSAVLVKVERPQAMPG